MWKIDLTLGEENIMEYGEEDQESTVRWLPVWSRDSTKELIAACPPFMCREFLADWVFFNTIQSIGNIYCWDTARLTERPTYFRGLQQLVVYSHERIPSEESVLEELCDSVVTEATCEDEAGYAREWGSSCSPVHHKLFVFDIPVWARNPYGMMIWSLSIRSQVEVGAVTPWPFPEEPRGNLQRMLEDAAYSGKDVKTYVRYLCDLYQKMENGTLVLPPLDPQFKERIGGVTHEYFSPMCMFNAMFNAETRARCWEWAKGSKVQEYRMHVIEAAAEALEVA